MREQNDVASNWGNAPRPCLLGNISGDPAEGTFVLAGARGAAVGLDMEALCYRVAHVVFLILGGPSILVPVVVTRGYSPVSRAQGSPFLHILADTCDRLSC